MTVQNKSVAAPAQDSLDEIDQIMNEIEELQQSMASAQAVPASSDAPTPPEAQEVAEEPNVMEEFQAGGSDSSMEETLANLKDEEPQGPNLIDQAIEAQALETVDESIVEVTSADVEEMLEDAELLDDAEASDLEMAIAAEEAEVEAQALGVEMIEEPNEEPMEEVTQMNKTPAQRMNTNAGTSNAAGSVSLALSGDMTLRLSYEFEGQEVTIGFNDGALQVVLSDGTEFKIPVRRAAARKAA